MEKEVVLTVQNIFKYLGEFNVGEVREIDLEEREDENEYNKEDGGKLAQDSNRS